MAFAWNLEVPVIDTNIRRVLIFLFKLSEKISLQELENFATKIDFDELKMGDLIFFGTKKVSHVALYLGDGKYIHSSGKEIGNNGIGINYIKPDRRNFLTPKQLENYRQSKEKTDS